MTSNRLKLRFNFLCPRPNDLLANLDSVKITDVLLCVYDSSSASSFDTLRKTTDSILNAIYSHCLPTTVHAVHGLEAVAVHKRSEMRKTIQKSLETLFPDQKFHSLDSRVDAQQVLNIVGNCKRRRLSYKERRSQVLVDKIEFVPSAADPEIGTLKAYGFVRSQTLNVNQIIHIPGLGNYQMSQVEVVDDPYRSSVKKVKSNSNEVEMDALETDQTRVYKADPFKQESLETENEIDPMEGEQTFPTPEDIAVAQDEHLKRKLKVPKGTSDYQAAWLVDEDEEAGDEDGDDDDEFESDYDEDDYDDAMDRLDPIEEEESDDDQSEFDDEQFETRTMTEVGEDEYDQKLNMDEEMQTLDKIKEEKMNEMFPDEVETPLDVAARNRFARYRGLKSFHKSAWDAKENLPQDYSRIFQFQNFNRSRKIVFQQLDDVEGPTPGEYVCVSLLQVRQSAVQLYQNTDRPLILYQMLRHEQKMSLINVILKKHPNFTQPIRSKERLVFHVGCRRYTACPIFSAHSNGDKYKYERFMRSDIPIVASFYAPITFAPASVCVFKQMGDGTQHLVATGSVMSVDPNRVVVKRVILTAHPYKIHKSFVVLRYMFFNREDILWFKPVELRTKYGRKGHIRESLGTHGHMKCVFDRTIKSHDTVMMNLYKRVYPKWTYDSNVDEPIVKAIGQDDPMVDEHHDAPEEIMDADENNNDAIDE
jgi:pre-rRNA-processing protein TSR1